MIATSSAQRVLRLGMGGGGGGEPGLNRAEAHAPLQVAGDAVNDVMQSLGEQRVHEVLACAKVDGV